MRTPASWLTAVFALTACAADDIPTATDDASSDSPSDATTAPLDVATDIARDAVIDTFDAAFDTARDAAIDAPRDTALDTRDAITDAGVDSLDAARDVAPTPSCDARFSFVPSTPGDDAPFEVRFTDATGWTYIGLSWSGPAAPSWTFVDVLTRDPFTWRFRVAPTRAGRYTVAFTAENGARRLGACTFDVASRGGVDASTPTDVAPVDASSLPFVTRSGATFTAGGARFRFIGMNSAGLPHYGSAPLTYARVDQIATELDEMRRMGVRVVRVFAAANDATSDVVATRLGRVLDLAASRGIYVLAALTDFYASTPYHPRGDDGAYARDPRFSIDLLSPTFFRSGYRTSYLPWVRAVVSRFASHPAVFAWELGNEIKCDDDHAAFIAFARDVSDTIRSLDARHMITTGMITARWASDAEARAIYGLPNVDFATYHNYNGTFEFADFDYGVARDTGRALVVEETGYESGDRASRASGDLRAHFDSRGAQGYMQWGFTVVTPDNGNGDRQFGMDRLFHAGDYDALFRVYSDAAARYR